MSEEPTTLVAFNPDNVALGDLEDLEEYYGLSLGVILEQFSGKSQIVFNDLSAKIIGAVAFLVSRQKDPDVDVKVVKRMTIGDLTNLLTDLEGKVAADPT